MDMLINNVDYFDTCEGCPCYDREWERCGVTLDTVWNPSIKRYEKNCLVKMIATPHGRLIDADSLIVALKNSVYANAFFRDPTLTVSQIEQLIEHQPTIIEAEGKS